MHCEKKAHVSRMSVSENHPTWAKRTWSGHSGQAWSSLIWPNHVQKTNQKNLHISAGKHPFDTFKVHKVCQLLCLKSQTSEHSTKGSTSDLRAFDFEVILQRRGSHSRHVPNHIGVVEVEPPQLREILQSCDVSEDLGPGEFERFQLREILQSRDVAGDLSIFEAEVRQLPEILQRLNVTRDLVLKRLSSHRSGNSLKRGLREPVTSLRCLNSRISTTLQPLLGWKTSRRGRRSHGSRLCWQISIASFDVSEKFSVSILVSSQKWATATPPTTHGKNYRKSWPLCRKSLHSTPHHLVQVLEFWFWQSQRQQDLLQWLLLGTRLQQPASICLGHSQLHSSSGTTVTGKL